MRMIISSLFFLAISANAFAYSEGTFTCKNAEGLPDNTYKIENVTVGSASLPYVEINRYFRGEPGEAPTQASIRGLATVSGSGSNETLSLAAVRLEFKDGSLLNCRE